MPIVTPKILPGEPGYISKKERTQKEKQKEKKEKRFQQKKETNIGKIKLGSKGYRLSRPSITPRKERRYNVFRYSRKIGEILVSNKDLPNEEITLEFNRLGGIGNYKHLIQDADFQLEWATREQELLLTQGNCYICKKKLSKTAIPHLYHYNLFKKRAELLEKAQKIPQEVVDGKITLEDGWTKFNNIIEEGNRYYMSLKDTALICSSCAKQKGLEE